jgi:hypothetical protein
MVHGVALSSIRLKHVFGQFSGDAYVTTKKFHSNPPLLKIPVKLHD